MKATTLTLILASLLAGCSHTKPAPQAAAPQQENPVIVRLVGQHQTVTITADRAGRGPLYSVADKNGQTLVANATLTELRTTHPDLYRQIEPAIAEQRDTDPRRKPSDADASVNKVPARIMMMDR